MNVNCAGIPLEYKLTYDKERRQIKTTKLSAVVKRAVRNAYGDPTPVNVNKCETRGFNN